MGQITIYLDSDTEEQMRRHVKGKGLSQSKWIAGLIREKLQTEWPESVVALAGAWKDFPTAEELRVDLGLDAVREPL
jgi:hypothetical protein